MRDLSPTRASGMVMPVFFLLACAVVPWTDDELAIHELINAHREGLGLAPFELHDAIGPPARAHSEAMLSGDVPFSHEGFDERVEEIEQAIELAGAGENVGLTEGFADPPEVLVQGWLNSPPHRENLEGEWDLTGIGLAVEEDLVYATQIFVLRACDPLGCAKRSGSSMSP